jgi:hypothetical protein
MALRIERHFLHQFADLEQSWADLAQLFVRGLPRRRDAPMIGHPNLQEIHRTLEWHREKFESGDRHHLFPALMMCVRNGLPVPYWLEFELSEIWATVHREPRSLHDLFGLERVLPTRGKRAAKAREDRKHAVRLRREVINLRKADPDLSLDAALRCAIRTLRFPYGLRKARDIFNWIEGADKQILDAMDGRRPHIA